MASNAFFRASGSRSHNIYYVSFNSIPDDLVADADPDGDIIDSYSYDAYGMMLGGNPSSPAATNLLYTGEQFDTNLQNYYLRARYYDPSNGRFNRLDPYAGNSQDPQSLHKYLYCHANPVNTIDPSGKFGFFINVTLLLSAGVFESILITYIGLQFVDAASILSGVPLSFETIQDLTRLWAIMAIQLSARQMSSITSSVQIIFEMAVMYVIDMALIVLSCGLTAASLRLSLPAVSGGTRTAQLAVKASKGANKHHILSKRIVDALNAHPNLAGVFRRADPRFLFKAASKAAHNGYELWHRAVDDVIVNWIRTHPNAGKKQFIDFVRNVYQNPSISARIPKVYLWNV